MRTVGHYRLKSLIGRGGTSEVYAAEHAVLGDTVALKLLRPELAADPAQARALVEEGMKVRAIDHPNVVRVLDAGIDPATHGCYLVMEHVHGETLAARLARGPLPEADVRTLGAQLADAVAAAHAQGIVHRDLKPANVILDGDRPKIVDFGIAKHLGARSAVTTARVIGTLAYMAPEQLASGMIAPCTDVWALGLIVFEALTGRLPFGTFDDGRCAQLVDEPLRASSLVACSPALDAIVARCLSRDPARRPASAADLAAMLRGEVAVVEDERITVDAGPIAPPSGAPTIERRRRRRGVAVGIGAAALAGILGIVIATADSGGGNTPTSTANINNGETKPSTTSIDGGASTADIGGGTSTGDTGGGRTSTNNIGGEKTPSSTTNRGGGKTSTSTADVGGGTSTVNIGGGRTTTPTNNIGGEKTPSSTTNRGGGTAITSTANSGGGKGSTSTADIRGDKTPTSTTDIGGGKASTSTTDIGGGKATTSAANTGRVATGSSMSRRIVVRSTPAGARVLVDGKRRGVTPLELAVELPETIVVERAGYRRARVTVERAGAVDVRLKRVRATVRRKETLD